MKIMKISFIIFTVLCLLAAGQPICALNGFLAPPSISEEDLSKGLFGEKTRLRSIYEGPEYERFYVGKKEVESHVALEILLLFKAAERLGLDIVITGGTAGNFAVSAYSEKTVGFRTSSDLDVAILLSEDEESGDKYELNEKIYEEFKSVYSGMLVENGFKDISSKVDTLPGTFLIEKGRYAFENVMRSKGGEYLSISRLGVCKEGERFVIFGEEYAVEDLVERTLRISNSDLDPLLVRMAKKMIGKGIVYKTAEFGFDRDSCNMLVEVIEELPAADYGKFVSDVIAYAETNIGVCTEEQLKTAFESILQKTGRPVKEGSLFEHLGIRDGALATAATVPGKNEPQGSPLGIFNILRKISGKKLVTLKAIARNTRGRSKEKGSHLSMETIKRDLGTLVFLDLAVKKGRGDKAKYRAPDLSPSEWIIIELVLKSLGARPASAQEYAARKKLKKGLGDLWEIQKKQVLYSAGEISDRVIKVILEREITSKEMVWLPWVVESRHFPKELDGSFRVFTDKEIYMILEVLNDKLIERDFAVDERLPFVKYPEPIEMLKKDLVENSYTAGALQVSKIRKLAKDLPLLFDALALDKDTLVVYLARDALSAFEFHHYLAALLGENIKATCVYQPGMDPSAIVSDYEPDEGIEKVLKATEQAKSHVIQKFQKQDLLPSKRTNSFYEKYHPDLFERISDEFTKEMAVFWAKDDILRQQADVLYRQMQLNNVTGEKKVLFIDLSATGKTLLYVKSVLEHYSLVNGLDVPQIDVFVGWSFDRKLCLPELRHYKSEFLERNRPFSDQSWPFFRTTQSTSGKVYFNIAKKRSLFLQLTMRSLFFYNEALTLAQKRSAERLDLQGKTKPKVASLRNVRKVFRSSVKSH